MRGLACLLAVMAIPAAATAAAPGDVQARFDAAIARARTAMMADPETALTPVLAAERLATGLSSPQKVREGLATATWLHGEALSRINQPDKALPILQKALDLAAAGGAETRLVADITLARGSAESGVGHIQAALQDFERAFALNTRLREGRGEAKALQSIADTYSDAGDYQRSLRYYAQVAEVYDGDPAIDLAAHNNLGEALRKLGRNAQAEAQYRIALTAARRLDSPLLEARVLTNLASAQIAQHELDGAQASVAAALKASAVSEAAGWRPFIWGVEAQIDYARDDLGAADRALARAFAGVDLKSSAPPFQDFHETAYHVYERLGRYPLALAHLAAFKRLDDQARQLTASTGASLLAARFDFANQDLRIARLKAAQSRKDAQLAQSRARLRTTVFSLLLGAGLLVLVLLLIGFVSLARSRNRVRAANASLKTANASLEQALKVKTEFLATTSHEIRTPLNGILGMTQVLLADRRLDPATRDRIGVVKSAGETMRSLVDDILDLAKIETGKLTIERGDLDLGRLLSEVAQLWRDQAEARGLRMDITVARGLRWIHEDEARLRQIVFNLVSNAVKFTHQGSIVIEGDTAGTGDDRRLRIGVRDTGIGIAADMLPIIFESFRQGDGGITRRYGGSGLGLAICRRLAQGMGGDVTVDSRAGEGSLFTLDLPLHAAQRADGADEPEADRPAPMRLEDAALLVAAANPLSQRVLSGLAVHWVASLAATASSDETLDLLRSARRFDHVLAEAPADLAGAELAAALRPLCAEAARRGVRLSILHKAGDAAALQPLAAGGEAQLIAKPIAGAALHAVLRGGYGGDAAAAPAASAA